MYQVLPRNQLKSKFNKFIIMSISVTTCSGVSIVPDEIERDYSIILTQLHVTLSNVVDSQNKVQVDDFLIEDHHSYPEMIEEKDGVT